MNQTQATVEEIIKNNKVVIFSQPDSPYCEKAKKLLAQLNVQFFDVELPPKDVQQYLQEKTGQHDFPNIFINEQHIGGYNDLENLSRTEELPKLLNKS
ncbi:hypothetical protein RMATCC62417_04093 [Rhizopus microsporus]|nr:hypothetical protein RMATCC62417_04093 [Rhizopus microsporus]